MHLTKSILLTLPMTLLLAAGCKKDSADSAPPEPATTPAPTPEPLPVAEPEPTPEPVAAAPEAPPAPPLTDGEIAAISKAANDGEIEHAKLAKKEKIEAKESDISKRLTDDASARTETLKATAKGAEFDRAYIAGQVEAHTAVLDLIDKQMLPAAHGPALKAELEKVRGAVELHLGQAKEIQAGLNPPAA